MSDNDLIVNLNMDVPKSAKSNKFMIKGLNHHNFTARKI